MNEDNPADRRSGAEDKSETKTTLWVLSIFSLVYLSALAFFFAQTAPCAPLKRGAEIPPEGFLSTFVSCRTSNELGDFLAGAFAPLAFLWLAGAVLIQSRELKAQREELAETRKEMEAMSKAANAQTDEARASKEFIGKQTAIMQNQLEREQLDDLLEEFEALIRTLQALMGKVSISYRSFASDDEYAIGVIEPHSTVKFEDKADNLREQLVDQIRKARHSAKGNLVRETLFSCDELDDLTYVVGQLNIVYPKTGAHGQARWVELGLQRIVDDVMKITEILNSDDARILSADYSGTPD